MQRRTVRGALLSRIAAADRVWLMLDYDGTLTPIVAHPAHARLSAATRRLLARLADRSGVRVTVLSGRALRDVARRVGVRAIDYGGNHGLEWCGRRLRFRHPDAAAARPLLRRLARRLREGLRRIPGAQVEDKGLTLSVHWRTVPPSAHRVLQHAVARLTAPDRHEGRVRLTPGKRVVEIRPTVHWDKGAMVTWLWRRAALKQRTVAVYLGDDQTDEPAFRAVNRLGGYSVVVGGTRRRTAARHRLRDPRAVGAWLAALARALERSRAVKGGQDA